MTTVPPSEFSPEVAADRGPGTFTTCDERQHHATSTATGGGMESPQLAGAWPGPSRAATAEMASLWMTASTSSPGSSSVGPRGVITSAPRSTATSTHEVGQSIVGDGAPRDRGGGVHMLLDERVQTSAQLEQRHHVAERHLLDNEMADDVGLVERDVDAISTVYSQALLGLLTRPIVRGNTEFTSPGWRSPGCLVAMRHRDDGAGTHGHRILSVSGSVPSPRTRCPAGGGRRAVRRVRVALDRRHGPARIEQQGGEVSADPPTLLIRTSVMAASSRRAQHRLETACEAATTVRWTMSPARMVAPDVGMTSCRHG